MTTQHLLLVDGDPRSLRMMEASLRKAGFAVTTAVNGREALEECERTAPDLILSDTQMDGMDGFELCRRIKSDARLRATPFIFLTGQRSVEDKVRGLELGVEDYLTKPIYVREVVTRVRMLLERKARERLEQRGPRAFSGRLAELGVVDLVQTLDIGKKSGTVSVRDAAGRTGTIWFRDGRVVDCEVARRQGEAAFYRLLQWQDGEFAIDFRPVARPERIRRGTQALLIEGMRRLDEWGRLAERLPPLQSPVQIDFRLLSERLAEIPDDVNAILRLVDGRRSLADVISDCDHDDLATGGILAKLWEERILVEAPGDRGTARDAPAPPAPAAPAHAGGEAAGEGVTPHPVDWLAGPATAAPAPEPREEPVPDAAATPAQAPHASGPPRIVRFAPRRKPAADLVVATSEREEAPRPVSTAEASGSRPTPRPARPAPADAAAIAAAASAASGAPPGVPGIPAPAGPQPRPARPRRTGPAVIAAVLVALVLAALAWGALAGREVASPYDDACAKAEQDLAALRYGDAAAAYRRALAERETSAAFLGLGRALEGAGDLVSARDAFQRAIALDERSADAYIGLGRIGLREQRPEEARKAFQRYLALEPEGRHAGEARAALADER